MKKIVSFIMAAALCIPATACGSSGDSSSSGGSTSKVTLEVSSPESIDSILDIKLGTNYDDVVALLGQPDKRGNDKYTWYCKEEAPFEGLGIGLYDGEYRYIYEVTVSDKEADKGKVNRIKCEFSPCRKAKWEAIQSFILEEFKINETVESLNNGTDYDCEAMNGSICFGNGKPEDDMMYNCYFELK